MTTLTGLVRGATDSVGSITPIANIAALRALTTSTGPDSPRLVYVADYDVAGAGGGGFFECQQGGNPATASFTASISNTMTVTAVASGYISTGDVITCAGIPANAHLVTFLTGTPGGVGDYLLDHFGAAFVLSSRAMTSTSDNGATCIVDASGRRWNRIWDKTGFDVRWAGIFKSNVDNGPLIGRLPKYVPLVYEDGIYQFASYPSFSDLFATISRGSMTVFNCTGALLSFNTDSPAFTWNWGPVPFHFTAEQGDIQYGTFNPGGGGPGTSVMANAGISPMEGISILAQFDGTFGVGLQLASPGNSWPDFTPVSTRPKNLTVGGFYVNVIYGPVISHTYLTGLDEAVMRSGGIGYRYDNYPNTDSGENMSNRRCNFNAHYGDGVQLVRSHRQDLDICSLTYNHRALYITGTPAFVSSYFETNISATPAEVAAVDENANLVFTSRTNFLHFDRAQVNIVQFGGTPGIRGSQVFFERCQFTDTASNNTNVPNGQFLQPEAGLQIFGSVCGWNGINFPPCLSPNQCMQPNWNFAIAGLALYPGSSGCTNQTSVVHSPQTNAVALTGAATLQLATMDVKPGELIYVTMYDEVVGVISSLAGSMVFKTADGVTVDTAAFSQTPSVADWHFNPVTLAPNWSTAVHGWAFQCFVFRVPIGASKMTGSFSTTGAGTYYISELAIYHQQ
jgi:hypothetical protein